MQVSFPANPFFRLSSISPALPLSFVSGCLWHILQGSRNIRLNKKPVRLTNGSFSPIYRVLLFNYLEYFIVLPIEMTRSRYIPADKPLNWISVGLLSNWPRFSTRPLWSNGWYEKPFRSSLSTLRLAMPCERFGYAVMVKSKPGISSTVVMVRCGCWNPWVMRLSTAAMVSITVLSMPDDTILRLVDVAKSHKAYQKKRPNRTMSKKNLFWSHKGQFCSGYVPASLPFMINKKSK